MSKGHSVRRDGSASVGSYRKRLIDAGLIEPCGYGKLAFAIPYMREYLLAHAE